MLTEIKNKVLNAHIGNGWNYGIELGNTKCRIFRYNTNGHQNTDYEYKKWVPIEKMEAIVGEDAWDSIDYLDQESYGNKKFVKEAGDILDRIFCTEIL